MELESDINARTWSPAQNQMIKSALAKEWRVPYSYNPEELAASVTPPNPMDSVIAVECSDIKTGKVKPSSEGPTKGLWCNCDAKGNVVRDEETCAGSDPERSKTCIFSKKNKYCRLKVTKTKMARLKKALWKGVKDKTKHSTAGLVIQTVKAFGSTEIDAYTQSLPNQLALGDKTSTKIQALNAFGAAD